MRNYSYKEWKDDDVATILDKQWSSTGEGDKRVWDTGFGVSFAMPSYLDTEEKRNPHIGWYFIYDSVGSNLMSNGMDIGDRKGGWIEPGEVVHLTGQLIQKSDEFSLFEKPISVIKLEEIYGTKASLHQLFFLHWHIKIEGKASCVNNPYDMCRSYASGPNQFEVLFVGDGDICEYMEIRDLLMELKKRYGTPENCCGYCWSVHKKVISRCTKCKKVHYCGVECQTGDWVSNKHSIICKKVQF